MDARSGEMYSASKEQINASPFRNIYWFSRFLIDTNQYGSIGTKREEALLRIVSEVERILVSQIHESENSRFQYGILHLNHELRNLAQPDTKLCNQIAQLTDELINSITTKEDLSIFCLSAKYVVAPINEALKRIPSTDKKFVIEHATAILNLEGESAVGKVIRVWDSMGVKACLNLERDEVVYEFARLLSTLSNLNIEHNKLDDNIILTAFVQEFERRLGQKRKSRGGTSLEDVVGFFFDYYKFKATNKPEHFDQDIEVDKWFKCKDGWVIGISCKRTLRERWKQLSQADRGTLSHFKIREIWHITTFDTDLSDDKIVRLGEQNHIFYLMDESEVYCKCKDHKGMSSYVRPLSVLISNIREQIS